MFFLNHFLQYSYITFLNKHKKYMTIGFSAEFNVKGHLECVTCLSVCFNDPEIIISGSRDKTIVIWGIKKKEKTTIIPLKRLKGHSHFVSDVKISSDGKFLISSSWDNSLRLWNINSGKTIQSFIGHQKDVLSVCFSKDQRQILSGSRDGTIRLWNTIGKCKRVFKEDSKNYWIIFVYFLPFEPVSFLSCSWDGTIEIWNMELNQIEKRLKGHKGYVHSIAISPDSSLCASGGHDGSVMLWDLQEGKHLYSLLVGEKIYSICFSPNRYWLCASTDSEILIWDLESKEIINKITTKDTGIEKPTRNSTCFTMVWSSDGMVLFSGYRGGQIKLWQLNN